MCCGESSRKQSDGLLDRVEDRVDERDEDRDLESNEAILLLPMLLLLLMLMLLLLVSCTKSFLTGGDRVAGDDIRCFRPIDLGDSRGLSLGGAFRDIQKR